MATPGGLQQTLSPARLATLPGGLPPLDDGGGGNAPGASPDATNAASLSLAPGSSALSAMGQGASQAINGTHMAGLAGNALGVPSQSLFSGDFNAQGLAGTMGRGAIGFGLNAAIPGFGTLQGLTTGTSGLLGALAGLATLYGQPGQQTDSHLSGPITEGLVAQIAQNQAPFNNPLNVPRGEFEVNDQSDPTVSDPDTNGNVSNNPEDGGPTSSAPASSDPGIDGDWNKGGTIPGKGNRDTVKGNLTPGEEVIRKSEASRPGVRPLLKEINKPGAGPVEGGLRRMFGRA